MNKILDEMKEVYKKTVFIIEFLLSILLGILTLKLILTKQEALVYDFKIIIKMVLIAIPILTIIIINLYKYRKDVAKIFLTIIIPIGMLYIFIMLPDGIPDERSHYFRMYDVSMGNIITPFGEDKKGKLNIPADLEKCRMENIKSYADVYERITEQSDYTKMTTAEEATKTYNAIPYIPGAIVCAIGRCFSINMIVLIYIIRIVNFMIFTILAYISIKIIPFGKLLFAIYMFTPMFIQQVASASFDSILNAIILLFISYNMYLLYRQKDLKFKDRFLYYILCITIAVCKYVYAPIIFINIFLLSNKNIRKKNAIKLIIFSTILTILFAGAWFVFTSQYPDERTTIITRNVNAKGQIENIINNPVGFLKTFVDTIKQKQDFYLLTFVGNSLGYLEITVPTTYMVIFIIMMVLSPFLENNEDELNRKQKIWCILIFIGVFILTLLGLYLTWTTVGATIIDGVQGRYFIPVAILILLAMCKKNNYIKIKNVNLILLLLSAILNLMVLQIIYNYYIV